MLIFYLQLLCWLLATRLGPDIFSPLQLIYGLFQKEERSASGYAPQSPLQFLTAQRTICSAAGLSQRPSTHISLMLGTIGS